MAQAQGSGPGSSAGSARNGGGSTGGGAPRVVKKVKKVARDDDSKKSGGEDQPGVSGNGKVKDTSIIPLRDIEYQKLLKENRALQEKLKKMGNDGSGGSGGAETLARIDRLETMAREVESRLASYDTSAKQMHGDMEKIRKSVEGMEGTVKELAAVFSLLAKQYPDVIKVAARKKDRRDQGNE